MRTLVSILLASTTLVLGDSPMAQGQASLAFYIVNPQRIDGGRFIDTPDFPKLGYISAVPQLEIKKLETVIPDERRTATTAKGSTFHIRMTPDDAKQFAVVTEQAVGKQMLIMLGDMPMMAVRVRNPIEGPFLQLHFDEKHDSASIGTALKALTN